MARSTFSGPVLVGDNRLGPLRNVGYAELVQGASLVLTNTTPATAGYGGSSGVFVSNVNIPNTSAVVYTQGTSTYAPQTITADTATLIYRGCVFYVPVGADLHDVLLDMQVVPTAAGGTGISVQYFVSNKFETASGVYFQTASGLNAVGRAALSTFTAAQMGAQQSTTRDIIQNGAQPDVSQVVVTIAISGTGMGALTAGTFNITLRYATPDNNIGNLTTYPYGNIG